MKFIQSLLASFLSFLLLFTAASAAAGDDSVTHKVFFDVEIAGSSDGGRIVLGL